MFSFESKSYKELSIKMPKEMITIELRKSPGQPWGMRIGGGVDRGKVLVIEKVRKNFDS